MAINLPARGIELVSGFCSGTMVNRDEVLVDIRSINKSVDLRQVDMFAFDNSMNIVNTKLVSTVEDFSAQNWAIDLSSGHHIECAETTILFDMELHWRHVCNLREGDQLVGVVMDESGMHGEPFYVLRSYRKPASLAEPVYYFETVHHNMLLPHFNEEKKQLTFICTHQ